MTLEDLLTELDYADSPCFLRRGDGAFESELGYGHIFRRAQDPTNLKKPRWRAEGVYGIRDSADKSGRFIPVVYVCTAKDDAAAKDLHRLLWNQDVAPYVIVHSAKGLRVYSGFDYTPGREDARSQGVLQVLTEFNAAHAVIEQFHRTAVDEGRLWRCPDLRIDPSRRVYHRLLASLRELDKDLRNGGVSKKVSHGLIGKYVYMHYLSARGILSEERLAKWGLTKAEIFGDGVKKSSLAKLTGHLDEWLNGEVFPLPWSGAEAPSAEAIRAVAGAFRGEERAGGQTQTHLDFAAYDFSFIPIETLSLVYEQFLHAEEDAGPDGRVAKRKDSKARKEGAYYTPLPLVNFVLAGLERQHPLTKGMKVLDPSSGSGSFLVQAYRLLIEKTFPDKTVKPKPAQLRALLEESIFGCDVDSDACQVTQLSLLLTLLDYVDPPDLTGPMHSFKLPTLCETTNEEKLAAGHTPNILQRNFFGAEAALGAAVLGKQGAKAEWLEDGFDWIVGNPPWKPITPKNLGKNDVSVWEWMKANEKKRPIGKNQVAQAFAWEAARYLQADGECALLVPAMALFEEPSQEFRKAFFSQLHVHTVANFANFAEVLFDGRARIPCAAISYSLRREEAADEVGGGIRVFSPFVVNQEATRPLKEGVRGKIWSLSVNLSEVRTLEFEEVITGSGLPWKLAMWGSSWDEKLLRRMERKWPRVRDLEQQTLIKLGEGPRLREAAIREENEFSTVVDVEETIEEEVARLKFERLEELVGKLLFKTSGVNSLRHLFKVPEQALGINKAPYICLIHGKGGLDMCEPPHIIVHAARHFAVYSDEFIILPSGQLGIVSCTKDKDFLKALSLFLSSDFAFYHQLLRTAELGIKRDRATLEALRQMPIPLTAPSREALRPWTELHAKLAKCTPRTLEETKRTKADRQTDLFDAKDDNLQALLEELNELTADALGLTKQERALIHDLVQVRYALNDGKRGDAAMRAPEAKELQAYARMLKEELDDFVGEEAARRHRITVVTDPSSNSAMVEIDFTTDAAAAKKPVVLAATDSEAKALRRTRSHLLKAKGASQWAYFNRNLRIYKGRKTYVLKPLERHHWTSSSALNDASEIIAETLAGA